MVAGHQTSAFLLLNKGLEQTNGMAKRLIVTCVIFFVLVVMVHVPILIRILWHMSRGTATGIGFVVGSLTENVFRVVVLSILAALAYWLSGKLLRHK